MMSLWAPHATFTSGGKTAAGSSRSEAYGSKSARSSPRTTGSPTTPRRRCSVTVNGDRGTLHFECHFIDSRARRSRRSRPADMDVARIDGRWLITRMVGGTAECAPEPVSEGHASAHLEGAAEPGKRRLLSPADNPARPGGRPRAGRGAHQAARRLRGDCLAGRRRRLLGFRLLGQSNERMATLGHSRNGPPRTASSEATRATYVCSSRRTSTRLLQGSHRARLEDRGSGAAVDMAIANAVAEIPPSTRPDILGFVPPPEDERYLRKIRAKGAELSKVIRGDHTVAPERVPRSLRIQCREDGRRPQPARDRARKRDVGADRCGDRSERERVHGLAEPVHRGRRGGDGRCAAARASCSPGR